MRLRTCPDCARAFKPRSARQTHCDDHDNRSPSPSTIAARDPEYRRNRAITLAGNPRCHWCARPATTADHLVAVAHGGTNALANLVPACEPCNKSRGARQRPTTRPASAPPRTPMVR